MSSRRPDQLDVRLLGGFQVRRGERVVAGFESQKTRALAAYLFCHPGRAFSREHLAALLWPEEDEERARHNLRQALYSLRRALGREHEGGAEPVLAGAHGIRFDPGESFAIDARAFAEAAVRVADPGGGSAELTRAAQLYRGDFLAGFYLKEGGPFEDWVLGEQERLREAALAVLRTLVERLGHGGEHELAVRYAQRLVEMDPLSEEAQRQLMRLYALAGRRSRALAQYEELSELLDRELGVEPLKETRALYEAIVGDELPEERARRPIGPPGPFVPLVGRGEAIAELGALLERAVDQGARITLIEGESGIGKTRLAKTFLNHATSQRLSRVLQGRCYEQAPPVRCAPFADTLYALLPEAADELADDTPVGRLATELAARFELPRPSAAGAPRPDVEATAAADPAELACELLAALAAPADEGEPPSPLVVFLDDFHLASAWSVRLAKAVVERLAGSPVWLLLTGDTSGLSDGHPLADLLTDPEIADRVDRLRLTRLAPDEIREIAAALIGDPQAAQLAGFLRRFSEGLPLAVAELVNLLCDRGVLHPQGERSWVLVGDDPFAEVEVPATLDELLAARAADLPTSARRLLTLAAMIGREFDVGLLQRAADENLGVVEIGIELMLERWLIRQHPRTWTADPRQRDLVLWARGVRRGSFEFAHDRVRMAVHESLNPLRRQLLHRRVAEALEARAALGGGGEHSEAIAHHWGSAGEWRAALPHLRRSAERAVAVGDPETALYYRRRALAAVDRAGFDEARAAAERRRIEAIAEPLVATAAAHPV